MIRSLAGGRRALGPVIGAATCLACVVTATSLGARPAEAAADGLAACRSMLNAEEAALARLYETSPRQRRRRVRCDPLLSQLARAHALDMGTRRYFKHVTPDGEGPNRMVERAGYHLPSSYNKGRRANNVEVIAAGHDTAEQAWQAWLTSRSHRPHVTGSNDFFRAQTDYGVGHVSVPGSRYGTYWVLISARRR